MAKKDIGNLVKNEQKDYYKRWREKNKTKIKTYNDRYWKKRVEKKLKEKS